MFFCRKPGGPVDWLIVGLGNPGPQYANTRHNAGFLALDRLAARLGAKVDRKAHRGLCGSATLAGQRCLLLKPQTYMNDSGLSVGEAARYYKLPPERVLVLFDDVSLDVGRIRLRRKGSDGGHNGIKSIDAFLGGDFPRVKIGVGAKPHPDYDLAKWVLSRFRDEDAAALDSALEAACDAAEAIVAGRMDEAMNRFN